MTQRQGKLFPIQYDPFDYRPIDPTSNKKFHGGFCPETGRPIDPKTGLKDAALSLKEFRVDSQKKKHPGKFDVSIRKTD
jgi:hypothetical protein